MAFGYTTIKTEVLDTEGNKLILRGYDTGTSGVVCNAVIEKTMTIRKKVVVSELSHANFFIPGVSLAGIGTPSLVDLKDVDIGGDSTRKVRGFQITNVGVVVIIYTLVTIKSKFVLNILGYAIPGAVISGQDIVADGTGLRQQEFTAAIATETFTLAATPKANTNLASGREVIHVAVQTGFTSGSTRFYKATPSIVDYDMPAANQIRCSGLVATDRVLVTYNS